MKLVLLKDIALFSAAQGAAGIVLAVYVFAAARQLGRAEFGVFQSLMSAYELVAIFLTPLNIAAVHYAGRLPQERKAAALGALIRSALWVGGIGAMAVVALSPFLAGPFQCKTMGPFASLAALVASSALLTTLYGGVQGSNLYPFFATVKTGEALLTAASGLLLISAGYKAAGAVGGYVIGMSLALIFVMATQRQLYCFSGKPFSATESPRDVARPLSVLGSLTFAANFPMIAAQVRLDEDTAGLFAALFALRNVVLPFAFAIAVPLYSRTASADRQTRLFAQALGATLAAGSVFLAAARFCPDRLFSLIFGTAYEASANYLFPYSIALFLHMVCVVVMFHSACSSSFAFGPVALPALAVSTLLLWPDLTIGRIIVTQIAAYGLCLLGSGCWRIFQAIRQTRKNHV